MKSPYRPKLSEREWSGVEWMVRDLDFKDLRRDEGKNLAVMDGFNEH